MLIENEQWETVKLGDVCKIVSGTTPNSNIEDYWDNGNYNWVTPAELKDETTVIYDTQRKITDLAIRSTSLKPFPPGTVILSSRAPIGKVAIAGTEMYCNQGFKNLICTDKIHNLYLFWFLKGKTEYLNSIGRGATFKEISKPIVEGIQISLPPLKEQKKIAAILDKAIELISLRKQQIEKLDLLVKSRFIEMFGDATTNDRGWNTKLLSELSELKSGGTPTRQYPEYFEGDIPWITTVSLGKATIDASNAVEYITEEAIKNSAAKIIPANSLLFGIRVGVGKVSKNIVPMCTNQDIVAITKTDSTVIDLIFLKHLLDEFSSFFNSQKRGATIQGIKGETLKSIGVILPPIELQNQFTTFVEQVDKSKIEIQQGLEKLETLKKALMQQYFG